jgi:orotate phosphoribosyltransferase
VTGLRDQAIDLVRQRGHVRRDEPFKLASGQLSHDYVDGKFAIDSGSSLRLVSEAIVELASHSGIRFNAVGGLTMGADALAHGIALVADCTWFAVRKETKPRGREQWIEGGRLGAEDRVLLVDDVVTSGGSIVKAYNRVLLTGAQVAGVIPMVDRGDEGARVFSRMGVAYVPLMTYHDLRIEPVRGFELAASSC